MVRLKTRYILFEILSPSTTAPSLELDAISDDFILLDAHKVSPQEISAKSIVQELRNSLRLNFGDYGAARANSLLQIKYFSNSTSTGIIRCLREDVDLVLLALFFINSVNGVENLIVNPVKVSGTIKKIELYTTRRNAKLSLAVRRRGESSTR